MTENRSLSERIAYLWRNITNLHNSFQKSTVIFDNKLWGFFLYSTFESFTPISILQEYIQSFQTGLFHLEILIYVSCISVYGFIAYFFLLNNIPLSGCTTVHQPIHLLKDIWLLPSFGIYELWEHRSLDAGYQTEKI